MRLADRLAVLYSVLILLALLLSSLVSAYSLADTLGEESTSYNQVFAEELVGLLETRGVIRQEDLKKRKLAFLHIEGADGTRFEYRVEGTKALDSSVVETDRGGYRVTLATSDQTVRREALEAVGRQLLAGVPAALILWLIGLYGLRNSVKPLELLMKYTETMASDLADEQRGERNHELRQLAVAPGETGGVAKSFLAIDSQLEATIAQLRKSLESQEMMKAELRVGREIQEGLLPSPLDSRSEFELATVLFPAKEMGGDLFHHFEIGDKLLIAVGDVSGKGVSAAMLMAVAQTLINHCTRESATLSEAVGVINQRLSEDNPLAYFLTLFIALYEPKTGRLEYVNAGHPRPLLRAKDGRLSEIPTTGGMGLGVMEGKTFKTATITIETGESLVVFTDGVTEAQNSAGELLGEGLAEIIQGAPDNADAMVRQIVASVKEFEGAAEQSDDLTLLVLRRC